MTDIRKKVVPDMKRKLPILLSAAALSCSLLVGQFTAPIQSAQVIPYASVETKAGWMEKDGERYYLLADGTPVTGWQEIDDIKYYFLEDGRAAKGRHEIDGKTYFFTASGMNILLVNRWYPVPEDYEADLVNSGYGVYIDSSCVEPLRQMMQDCIDAHCGPSLVSGYRSYWDQFSIYYSYVSELGSETAAQMVSAFPGTSEHQLGLAVDICQENGDGLTGADTPTQRWMLEHCWDYGFIVRYTDGTSDYTGIMYEPWHFRYVGYEFAQEMKGNGLCLEEYMDMLTNDGTSCGGIDKE